MKTNRLNRIRKLSVVRVCDLIAADVERVLLHGMKSKGKESKTKVEQPTKQDRINCTAPLCGAWGPS